MKNKIEITRRTHPGHLEFEEAKKQGIGITQFFGKYQYIYEMENKRISLIQLRNYRKDNDMFWEIYCLKGKLFEDVERFDTKKEAEKRIYELLKI